MGYKNCNNIEYEGREGVVLAAVFECSVFVNGIILGEESWFFKGSLFVYRE